MCACKYEHFLQIVVMSCDDRNYGQNIILMSSRVFLISSDIADRLHSCYPFSVLLSIKLSNNTMGFLEVFTLLNDAKISDIIAHCSSEYFNATNTNKSQFLKTKQVHYFAFYYYWYYQSTIYVNITKVITKTKYL